MKYRISLTRQAESDLQSIYQYIAVDLLSPQNAAGLLERLEKSIASLDQMPERYRVYDAQPWNSRNLRIMPVGNYLVFYISDHKTEIVTVIRVLYGRRDIDTQLNQS